MDKKKQLQKIWEEIADDPSWKSAGPEVILKTRALNAARRKKKLKYRPVDLGVDEFKDEDATEKVLLKIPAILLKKLKRLSLNGKYAGKF